MPYTIVKRGSKFCVVKKSDPKGKSFGCHESKAKARRQIGAIRISETQKERK